MVLFKLHALQFQHKIAYNNHPLNTIFSILSVKYYYTYTHKYNSIFFK
jgi:hypothetical protein